MKKNTQHNIRENIIFFIYRQQLLNHNLTTAKKELLANDDDFSSEIINNLLKLFNNKNTLIQIINKYLKTGWHFLKLSNLEQAILLWSTYEILILKIKSGIIINEAILITKKYFINDEHKYINGVLQNITDNPPVITRRVSGVENNGNELS